MLVCLGFALVVRRCGVVTSGSQVLFHRHTSRPTAGDGRSSDECPLVASSCACWSRLVMRRVGFTAVKKSHVTDGRSEFTTYSAPMAFKTSTLSSSFTMFTRGMPSSLHCFTIMRHKCNVAAMCALALRPSCLASD